MSPTPSPLPAVSSRRELTTMGVCISAVALVVSSSTLATDLTGLATLGGGYVAALVIGMIAVALVIVSTCDLALCHPRAGGIYQYTRAVLTGRWGQPAGLFLALLFFGTFLFSAAAETRVTAEIIRDAVGAELPMNFFVIAIGLFALAPNLGGLRSAAGITGILLIVMLGVRWAMGLSGFFGWSSAAAEWDAARLFTAIPAGTWNSSLLLGPALALGLWTFVGLEGTCALVEDIKRPSQTLPRGLALAMLVILSTSLILTLGLGGALPREAWIDFLDTAERREQTVSLVVGNALFGRSGSAWMAASAFASTTSTLIIALAAVPRMIMALARDGLFFGRWSRLFARVNPRTGSPTLATMLVGGLYLGVALASGPGMRGVYAAAYLYFFRYIVLHVLALINARHNRHREQRPAQTLTRVCAVAGFGLTLCVWYVAFAGQHALFSLTASAVAGGAVVLALGAWLSRRFSGQTDFHREKGATREPSTLAALQLLSVRSEVPDSSQAGMPVFRHGRAAKMTRTHLALAIPEARWARAFGTNHEGSRR